MSDGFVPVEREEAVCEFRYGLAEYWKGVVVGVCALWSMAEPSQNKRRKARPDKTEGEKQCVIPRNNELDTGEWLPINAIQSWQNKMRRETQTNKLRASWVRSRFLDSQAFVFLYCSFLSLSTSDQLCHLPAPRYALLTPPKYVVRHLIQPFIASGAERRYLGKCQTRRKRDIAGIMRCEWNGVLGWE